MQLTTSMLKAWYLLSAQVAQCQDCSNAVQKLAITRMSLTVELLAVVQETILSARNGTGGSYVGWGGNFLTMQNVDDPHHDAIAAESPPVDPPGTVQVDSGGSTLESLIVFKRSSSAGSLWDPLPQSPTGFATLSARPSTLSMVCSRHLQLMICPL